MNENMFDFIPASEDKPLYIHLTKDYIKTLHRMDNRVIWIKPEWEGNMEKSVLIEMDGEIVGFVTAGFRSFNRAPNALYIDHIYIRPEYRRKGVGLDAIIQVVGKWNGDVATCVLEKNMGAKSFFAEVERKMNWYRGKHPELVPESGYDLRVFRKKHPLDRKSDSENCDTAGADCDP